MPQDVQSVAQGSKTPVSNRCSAHPAWSSPSPSMLLPRFAIRRHSVMTVPQSPGERLGSPFDLLSAAPLNATRPRRVEDLAGPERSCRPGDAVDEANVTKQDLGDCPAKTPPSPLPSIDPATRGPAGPPRHPPCPRIQRVGLSRVDRHVPESPPTRPAPLPFKCAPGGATRATSVRDMCLQAGVPGHRSKAQRADIRGRRVARRFLPTLVVSPPSGIAMSRR